MPALIISPFSVGGTIDKNQYDHTSILKLIEAVFDVPPLGGERANMGNLLSAFQFPTITPSPDADAHGDRDAHEHQYADAHADRHAAAADPGAGRARNHSQPAAVAPAADPVPVTAATHPASRRRHSLRRRPGGGERPGPGASTAAPAPAAPGVPAIPEAESLLLLGAGLGAVGLLAGVRRRRR